MHLDYYQLACDLWALLAAIWVLGMLTTKSTVRSQSPGSRLLEMGLSLLAFCLVFTRYFQSGWLGADFLPKSDLTGTIGLTLTLLGVALAIWARFRLGGNWSGAVTLKHGHTLVRRGPYAIVRHPIYTGFLLAILGVALTLGQFRGLIAFATLFLSLWLKASMEERFMLEQFGPDYHQYQTEVKALIPYIF